MSIADCEAMIEKYTDIMTSVDNLRSYLTSGSDLIDKCIPYVEQSIIDGKQIDDGKLSIYKSMLTDFEGVIDAIVVECEALIGEYRALLAILIAEANAAETASGETVVDGQSTL